jgi:hypothetical protein
MSKGFWKVLFFAVMVTLLLFVAWYPNTLGGRQHHNMAIAGDHLPSVRAILAGDGKFKDVEAFVYTGQGGAVGLFGSVETNDDLLRLMRAVANLRLPVAVYWNVEVIPEGQGKR